MRPVALGESDGLEAYERVRPAFRQEVMAAKALRRIHVGHHARFLFQNPLTIRYQVLEMIRADRITREADILHELDTYNGLLGDSGELGCTLLIDTRSLSIRRVIRTRHRIDEDELVRHRCGRGAAAVRPGHDQTVASRDQRRGADPLLQLPGDVPPLPGVQLHVERAIAVICDSPLMLRAGHLESSMAQPSSSRSAGSTTRRRVSCTSWWPAGTTS